MVGSFVFLRSVIIVDSPTSFSDSSSARLSVTGTGNSWSLFSVNKSVFF